MTALIIDDEELARELIKEYLIDHPEIELLGEAADGFEAMKLIQRHQPDLLFLDIQMPRLSGIELLELIEKPIKVIFTTAFDEHAVKAFALNAIDYLLKPIEKERFEMALQRVQSISQESISQLIAQHELPERLSIKNGHEITLIPYADIWFLEANDDYVIIHSTKGQFQRKKSLTWYEEILPSAQFVRIHRSFIVRISAITKIELLEKDSYVAVLQHGEVLSISKTGYPKLKQALRW